MSRRLCVTCVWAVALVLQAPAAALGATKTVYAGPPARAAGAPEGLELNGFYREHVTVRVGDTVRWELRGFHNVLFAGEEEAPPLLVADTSRPYAGFRDAAGALLWFNGQPSVAFNPRVALGVGDRTFEGTDLHNSGLPLREGVSPYRLRFTRPGNFRYLCTVHPGMEADVKVVSRRRPVPSAAADRRAALREMRRDVRRANRLEGFRPRGNRVVSGHDRDAVAFLRFFPERRTIAAGETVEFSIDSVTEIHNVVFGAARYRLRQAGIDPVAPGGAEGPAGALQPRGVFPSEPPAAGTPNFDGTNHGNGFLNTGILDTNPLSPSPISARVRFPRRGTFTYECTIHPGMIGWVVVR
jgi:plastocyanin